ncbi:hypothetical protein [Acidithrix ferrooxidans]|uniref:Uncharacterized protein n=1 Tax=Acidithrix ferrooxidans TaxID=1280514 RepID=A0A0D8HGV2_9ACTN|nr:hypothetical protein [Acidithrix ferrooxidans]KJF16992.1 hypothetical protein AXFE_21270 [Acidithrix ferrooxidans]
MDQDLRSGSAFVLLEVSAHYLGRREVTPEIVEKVARQLSFEELTRLLGGRLQMSAWLDDLLAPTAHQELIHSA